VLWGIEEGVTNSVYLGGPLHKRDDICANILFRERRKCSRYRKHVQRHGGTRAYDIFVIKILDMYWWEGEVDEVRVHRAKCLYPLGEIETYKRVSKRKCISHICILEIKC
jgi:hypothetical protein